jgi:hypothetical protein
LWIAKWALNLKVCGSSPQDSPTIDVSVLIRDKRTFMHNTTETPFSITYLL